MPILLGNTVFKEIIAREVEMMFGVEKKEEKAVEEVIVVESPPKSVKNDNEDSIFESESSPFDSSEGSQ